MGRHQGVSAMVHPASGMVHQMQCFQAYSRCMHAACTAQEPGHASILLRCVHAVLPCAPAQEWSTLSVRNPCTASSRGSMAIDDAGNMRIHRAQVHDVVPAWVWLLLPD